MKKKYIRPETTSQPLSADENLLDFSVDVDSGTEGNQEEAEANASQETFDETLGLRYGPWFE